MDIIKILHEIAQNEHENFRAFKERLTQYCIENEKAFIQCEEFSSFGFVNLRERPKEIILM